MLLRKTARSRGCAPKIQTIGSPRPRSAARAMAGLLARGSTTDADLPGFPVIMSGVVSPLTVAGAATASALWACTVFPFDPRREPSQATLTESGAGRKRG